LIGDETESLPIPGEKFGFEILHQAQALGDFRSLDEKGRRVILIRLGEYIDEGLNTLYQSVMSSNNISAYQEVV
jgi:transaldolase / glucose-6-phosphate isomerase